MNRQVNFEKDPTYQGKTGYWEVIPCDENGKSCNGVMGTIEWDNHKKKFCFVVGNYANLDDRYNLDWDCLREIADFCQSKTVEYRALQKATKKAA
jgi:hypothetical protein